MGCIHDIVNSHIYEIMSETVPIMFEMNKTNERCVCLKAWEFELVQFYEHYILANLILRKWVVFIILNEIL